MYIQCKQIEVLCQVIEIVREEVIGEEVERKGSHVMALKSLFERIVGDVQERLTFVFQTFLRDEIASYSPSLEDLDYPNKLNRKHTSPSLLQSFLILSFLKKQWHPSWRSHLLIHTQRGILLWRRLSSIWPSCTSHWTLPSLRVWLRRQFQFVVRQSFKLLVLFLGNSQKRVWKEKYIPLSSFSNTSSF